MNDIDPDIQAAFGGQESGASASGNIDPEIAAAFQGDHSLKHPISPQSVGVGVAENAFSGITSGVGSLADALALGSKFPFIGTGSSDPGSHDITYRPRTEAGQEIAGAIGKVGKKVSGLYDTAFSTGPLATTLKERIPEALGAVGTVTGAAGLVRGALADGGNALGVGGNPQSISAAAASPNLSAVSPELQNAITQARAAAAAGNGRINLDALNRHVEAESLPIPMRLLKGQATLNPSDISDLMNKRGAIPGAPERLQEQNGQLFQNIQALRDDVGERVFSTTDTQHADTLIKAYKDMDAPIKADVKKKYQALEDANGGQFPLDTKSFVGSTDAALSKALKTNSVPPDISATLNEFRNGRQMTFEDFEAMRSDAADAMRSSSDGRQRAAAKIIRDQLEKMPLTPEAAQLKPLADSARAANKARMDAMEADPAYDAAVHDTVPPDRFVHKFITGPSATRDGVAIMRKNLTGNDTATSTMGVAALDHLRDSAGANRMGTGNFSQSNFNKAFGAMQDKIPHLLDPKTADTLDTLGNVANYTQFQPRGSFVNNSNTTVAAHAMHMGKNLAEGAINAKTFGIGGTLGRRFLEGRAAAAKAREHLAPGAGILETSTP